MIRQTHVFRPVAVGRYSARAEGMTLPRFSPPGMLAPIFIVAAVLFAAVIASSFIRVPVHETATVTAAHAHTLTITTASAPAACVPGQRVFVRRRTDGVLLARGTVVRILTASRAEARVEARLPAIAPAETVATVETGSQTLLTALRRRAAAHLPIH